MPVKNSKYKILTVIALMLGLSLLLMAAFTYWAQLAKETKSNVASSYIQTNQIIASTIDQDRFGTLTLSISDKSDEYYKDLYSELKDIYLTIYKQQSGLKSIFIVKIIDNKAVYVVDSIDEFSFGHINPGDIYEDAPIDLFEAYKTGTTIITDEYTNQKGSLVSVFTPIRNALNGQIVGVVGMDIDRNFWQSQTDVRLKSVAISGIIALTILITAIVYGKNTSTKIKEISLYQSALYYSKIPILIIDSDGIINMSNMGVERILGYQRSDLKERPIAEIINREDIIKLNAEISTAFLANNTNKIRIRINTANSTELVCDTYIALCPNSYGESQYCSIVLADITSDVKTTEEIYKSYKELNNLYSKFTEKFLTES